MELFGQTTAKVTNLQKRPKVHYKQGNLWMIESSE